MSLGPNTTENVTLNPGTDCGGIDIQNAGEKVTLNSGVYVMRNGNFHMEPPLSAGAVGQKAPNGMPVGPDPATVHTTVSGYAVTLLLEGKNTILDIEGGNLKLTAPTLANSPSFGGLALYSYDDTQTYATNFFQNANVTFIGTADTRNKKVWSFSTNINGDCDIVCLNIGNLDYQNTKVTVYPGQYLGDPTTMALNARVRRPSYPMIRIEGSQVLTQ